MGLIRLLARLEYGVFLFCDRKRADAEAAGYVDLAAALKLQAAQELGHHSQMRRLAGDFGYSSQPSWAKSYSALIHSAERVPKPLSRQNDWTPEGISRRYVSTRIWFGGQRACDLDWENAIALMAVGEAAAAWFYRLLSWLAPALYREVFRSIADDEAKHQDGLHRALVSTAGEDAEALLWRWRWRGCLALTAVPFDFAVTGLRWVRRRFGDRC